MSRPRAAMATAGRRPSPDMLVDVDRLVGAYYSEHPDPSDPARRCRSGPRATAAAR